MAGSYGPPLDGVSGLVFNTSAFAEEHKAPKPSARKCQQKGIPFLLLGVRRVARKGWRSSLRLLRGNHFRQRHSLHSEAELEVSKPGHQQSPKHYYTGLNPEKTLQSFQYVEELLTRPELAEAVLRFVGFRV